MCKYIYNYIHIMISNYSLFCLYIYIYMRMDTCVYNYVIYLSIYIYIYFLIFSPASADPEKNSGSSRKYTKEMPVEYILWFLCAQFVVQFPLFVSFPFVLVKTHILVVKPQ